MKCFILSALALSLAASASALTPSTSNVYQPEQKPAQGEYQNPPGRVPGDTVEDPFVIGALPFTASGTTVGFANDYDAVCPYSGSTAPDVVYKFVATANTAITVDLCASTYDTKVYIFAGTAGNVIACNDDYCAFQSQASNVPLLAGTTYYIVVDGYGSSAGNYVLNVTEYQPCVLTCPPGAVIEGEPDCYPNYNDTYNGGCNAVPFPVFQVILPNPTGGPVTICGTTGVFAMNTSIYRDTDWFQVDNTQTSYVCLSGDSEIPTYFFIIDGRGGCAAPPIVAYGIAGPCAPIADLCYTLEPGIWWVWAGPTAWDPSFACGSLYNLTISGYCCGPTPAESTTWGRVKGMFR
jgi:hypothetical protein